MAIIENKKVEISDEIVEVEMDDSEDNTNDTDSNKESDASELSDVDDDEKSDSKNTNAGWVDSIAKILKTNKPKGKKSLVLSKAKKLTDIKEKPKSVGFQIQTQDGEIKEQKLDPLEILVEKLKEQEPPRKRRKEINDVRIKPNILDKDREKTLSKIATKGVVQLFNAVKMQQKDIDKKLKEAGPLEVKRDKVLKNVDKRVFLDVLMGEKSENVENVLKSKATKSKAEPTWNVLRDDFMMGTKLKDWDKELEDELENETLETE